MDRLQNCGMTWFGRCGSRRAGRLRRAGMPTGTDSQVVQPYRICVLARPRLGGLEGELYVQSPGLWL